MALLTADDMVDRLGKSVSFWHREARAKRIPHHRLGRSIRWSEDDVKAILSATKVDPRPPAAADIAPGSARRARSAR